jgi:hypothetical protein
MPDACPSRDQLAELLSDRLDGGRRELLENHLGGCGTCQHVLQQLAGDLDPEEWALIGGPSDAGGATAGGPEPPAGFLRRLQQGLPLDKTPCPAPDLETPQGLSTGPEPDRKTPVPGIPVVPGFEVLEELGRGGTAVVYKARQANPPRLVALKVLHVSQWGPESLGRARRGIEAIASVRHPNVVQLFGVGQHEGLLYTVLEYVEGGNLHRQLKGTAWPPTRAARLLRTVAEAVHAVHRHGIVHRDLKTSNILLTADGTPKVADFGLAKHLGGKEDLSQAGDIVGTPNYMAPEQALGNAKGIGPATDVYALGVILHELLTGRLPFHGASRLETLYQVVHLEPMPPSHVRPEVPRDLEIICLKCLRKEPELRYGTARELAADLGRFLTGRPIRARPCSAWERTWKWARRRPLVAVLAGLLLLLAFGGGLGLFLERRALHRAHQDVVRELREKEETLKRAEAALEEAETSLYQSRIAQARHACAANRFTEAKALLLQCVPKSGQPDRRGPEWHDLWRRCQPERQP